MLPAGLGWHGYYPLLTVTLLLLLASGCLPKEVREGDPEWVDPLELFDVPASHNKDEGHAYAQDTTETQSRNGNNDGSTGSAQKEKDVNPPTAHKDFHFRRLVDHVLTEFDQVGFEFGQFRLEGEISRDSVDVLRNYRNGEAKNPHEVYDALVDFLEMKPLRSPGEDGWHAMDELPFIGIARRPWYQDVLFCCLGGGALIFLMYTIMLLLTAVRGNFWGVMTWAVLVLFMISVPWEWYRLYSEAQSKQMAEIMKGIPEACQPDSEISMWTNVGLVMKSVFIVSEDPCLKHQKALLVSPLSEVTPAQAIAVAFTRLFTDPLVYVFGALGKCTKALMVELPVVSHVFVAILIPIFLLFIIILLVLTAMRYSIRVPFLLSIAPSAPTVPALSDARRDEDSQQLRALRQESSELRRMLSDQIQRQQQVERIEARAQSDQRSHFMHAELTGRSYSDGGYLAIGDRSRSQDIRRVEHRSEPVEVLRPLQQEKSLDPSEAAHSTAAGVPEVSDGGHCYSDNTRLPIPESDEPTAALPTSPCASDSTTRSDVPRRSSEPRPFAVESVESLGSAIMDHHSSSQQDTGANNKPSTDPECEVRQRSAADAGHSTDGDPLADQ
ncbi:chloride channel CLIC-like protein 1 [Sycon ciliatum]|uniref:chloride channel CLIC-like protein 1 n=1 Tax=Sycon ciliatum TaxID=27933 RepID=UPI0031F62FE9